MHCLKWLLVPAILAASPFAFADARDTDHLPNIIFILTDDQGYGDLGCYGSTDIATPNIDRLSSEGIQFNSFYVHNRCSPTRAALMTGCHAHRVGVSRVIYRKDRAGIDAPSDRVIDGRCILPYMRGDEVSAPIHEAFVVPGSAIRHRDWKLLVKAQSPGGGNSDTRGKTDRVPAEAGSLFNLRDDLGETTDVSARHPEKVQKLNEMMNAFMTELEANSRPLGGVPGISE